MIAFKEEGKIENTVAILWALLSELNLRHFETFKVHTSCFFNMDYTELANLYLYNKL